MSLCYFILIFINETTINVLTKNFLMHKVLGIKNAGFEWFV